MRTRFVHRSGVILAGLLLFVAGGLAQERSSRQASQEEREAQPNENVPPINDIRIRVWDMALEEYIQEVEPGGTVTIRPGQQVRLRMVAKQRRNARGNYFPSTRFSARDSNAVTVDKVNPEVGAIIVTGRERRSRNLVIDYEILENWQIPSDLRTGRVIVQVDQQADVLPPEESEAPQQEERGAVLFEHKRFTGVSEAFLEDDDDLHDNRIGDNRLSSVQVDDGCVVRIFEHTHFRGDYTEIAFDRGDLDGEEVGDNVASSIQVRCSDERGPDRRRGAAVYRGTDFSGESDFFAEGGYPEMDGTNLGNDRARSVRVTPGCVAILYEDEDFRGRYFEVRGQQNDLRYTAVGSDRLSSLRVECD